ncbi:hypothetical protein IF1G_00536 [Cordyceps javanica]|uniref:Uncharacterized protein n=1 Tax=Cordyceps javanica TaxID=43265 RepID=A0A545VFU6_9HYPO|nr:hypothetical protein IF1G_00536 [Cordyceps javanica]
MLSATPFEAVAYPKEIQSRALRAPRWSHRDRPAPVADPPTSIACSGSASGPTEYFKLEHHSQAVDGDFENAKRQKSETGHGSHHESRTADEMKAPSYLDSCVEAACFRSGLVCQEWERTIRCRKSSAPRSPKHLPVRSRSMALIIYREVRKPGCAWLAAICRVMPTVLACAPSVSQVTIDSDAGLLRLLR